MAKRKQPRIERCAKCGYTRVSEDVPVHVAPLYGAAEPTEHTYIPEYRHVSRSGVVTWRQARLADYSGGTLATSILRQMALAAHREYPGVIVLIRDGKNLLALGEDAEVVAKELHRATYERDGFAFCAIPAIIRHAEIDRLTARGLRVALMNPSQAPQEAEGGAR